MMEVQVIGIDAGRGFLKGYSEYQDQVFKCCFKSVRSAGRKIEFTKYDNVEDPIFIEYNGRQQFVGSLAELEGHNPISNFEDDKTTDTVDILIAAALSKLAQTDRIALVLGVPHKCYTKRNLINIQNYYKGKTYKVRDMITKTFKEVTVEAIEIFKEADAALLWHTANHYQLGTNDVAMINVGFRTTELSYYDNIDGELIYNDRKSDTVEMGNKTALESVASMISTKRPLHEIDNSTRYEPEKDIAYADLRDSIHANIESKWINLHEVDVFVAGGTPHRLGLKYKLIEDPQMATSKGLYAVGQEIFADLAFELDDLDVELEVLDSLTDYDIEEEVEAI